ncbi:hypothetical protein ACQP1V_33400 [Microtetraspora malaysiensis]|uniref:hypothetical protein n=1 Tax=Microtetraspora malaysiensis TaxID=161358 RepID=UPI003D9052A8
MHVDAGGDRGKEPDDWKSGIGDLVADLLSYWTFGAGDYTGSSRPYGPVRLIVWTALSIGVAAAVRLTVAGTLLLLAVAGVAAVIPAPPETAFGGYTPAEVSAGSQPDFYMGAVEGSLRLIPSDSIYFPDTVPLLFSAAFTAAAVLLIAYDRRTRSRSRTPSAHG